MFIVFAGDNYHPSGGWNDFAGMYSTFDDAYSAAIDHNGDWAQIVNLDTLEKIDL